MVACDIRKQGVTTNLHPKRAVIINAPSKCQERGLRPARACTKCDESKHASAHESVECKDGDLGILIGIFSQTSGDDVSGQAWRERVSKRTSGEGSKGERAQGARGRTKDGAGQNARDGRQHERLVAGRSEVNRARGDGEPERGSGVP